MVKFVHYGAAHLLSSSVKQRRAISKVGLILRDEDSPRVGVARVRMAAWAFWSFALILYSVEKPFSPLQKHEQFEGRKHNMRSHNFVDSGCNFSV